MINCPCKDCENKKCTPYHAECEAYKAFRAEKEKEYKERLKNYHTNYVFYRRRRNEAQ